VYGPRRKFVLRRAVVGRKFNHDAALIERDCERLRRKQMAAGSTGREQDQLFCVTCGHCRPAVMPGHSRSKNGVLSHAYVPGIHVFRLDKQTVDGTRNSGLPELRKRLNGLSQVG
jgi:hypothetical protein